MPTSDSPSRVGASLRGALVGALTGLAVFSADLFVTQRLYGHRFESTGTAWTLVGIVALAPIVLGALVGLVWGGLLRGRFLSPLVLPLLGGVVAAAGFHLVRQPQHVVRGQRIEGLSAERRPDVLWIVIDTLRADALYGQGDWAPGESEAGESGAGESESGAGPVLFPDAPQLSALAQGGTVFTEAEAPTGWTIPSTAALLTGVHSATLGARGGYLPAEASTAAELLKSSGWRTLAHIDNTLLDESNGFAAGFERFTKQSPMDFGWKLSCARLLGSKLQETVRHRMPISYSGAENLVDRAIEDLEQVGEDPVFLYVHAMDVHAPYWTELEDRALAEVANTLPGLDGTGRDLARKDAAFLPDEAKDAIRALYSAELRHVDAQVGRLLERFDALRGLDDTIVVITADHGEEFWEHGKMGHGHALWGEVVRVPLVVKAPGIEALDLAAQVDAPVSLIDVLPTMADLVGLAPADGAEPLAFEGRSFAPLLRGETLSMVPLHAEQFRFNREIHRWREGDLVLVRANLPDDRLLIRLFDVGADPEEAHDLAEERSEDLARLVAALDAHLDTVDRASLGTGSARRNTAGLDDLGY